MRKVSIKTARARADRAMSLYIRQKHSMAGFCRCVSCGAVELWQDVDCGHFIPRGKSATRFMEENCWPQCRSCNRFRAEEAKIHYTRHMIETYGKEFVDELLELSKTLVRRRVQDYLDIEADFKAKLKAL